MFEFKLLVGTVNDFTTASINHDGKGSVVFAVYDKNRTCVSTQEVRSHDNLLMNQGIYHRDKSLLVSTLILSFREGKEMGSVPEWFSVVGLKLKRMCFENVSAWT